MNEKQEMPAFQSEAEEAQWWYDNREVRDAEFAEAIRSGRAGRSTLAARLTESRETIRVKAEDVATARRLAEQRGLEYQTYCEQIFHEALQRDQNQVL